MRLSDRSAYSVYPEDWANVKEMREMKKGILIIFFIAVWVFLYGNIAVKAEARSSSGEVIFNKYCAQCHGAQGAGTDKGPPLVHKIYHPNHHADITFYLAAERGVRAHHWGFGDMPRVEGVKKEDVAMIISYVRQLQKKAGIF